MCTPEILSQAGISPTRLTGMRLDDSSRKEIECGPRVRLPPHCPSALVKPLLGSPDTIRQPTARMVPAGSLHVKPGQDALSSCACRHQHTPVEAGSAGQEALEAVDGREAGSGSSKARSSPYTGSLAALFYLSDVWSESPHSSVLANHTTFPKTVFSPSTGTKQYGS